MKVIVHPYKRMLKHGDAGFVYEAESFFENPPHSDAYIPGGVARGLDNGPIESMLDILKGYLEQSPWMAGDPAITIVKELPQLRFHYIHRLPKEEIRELVEEEYRKFADLVSQISSKHRK